MRPRISPFARPVLGHVGPADGRDRLRVEVEQVAQRLGVAGAAGLGRELLDPHGRRVQQLVDDPAHGLRDLGAACSSSSGSRRIEPRELDRDDLGGHGPQRDDGGRDVGRAAAGRRRRAPPRPTIARTSSTSRRGRAAPASASARCRRACTPGELADAGVDVARAWRGRAGRAAGRRRVAIGRPARRRHGGRSRPGPRRCRRSRRSACGQRGRHCGQPTRGPPTCVGEPLGAVERPVRDHDVGRRPPARSVAAASEDIEPAPITSARFPGTASAERARELLQADADQRLAGPVDAGLGVGPLADPQRLLEQVVEQPAGGVQLLRQRERVLDLAEDLRPRRRPSSPARRPPRTGGGPPGPRSARRGTE